MTDFLATTLVVRHASDSDDENAWLTESQAMMAFTEQAHACLQLMVCSAHTELKEQFKGFELVLIHCGERIDVRVFTPVCARERAVIEQSLLLPVEFSTENGLVMVNSGFPVAQVGTNAQVDEKHKSQLAFFTGRQSNGVICPNSAADAVRFLFSSHLAAEYPHWLDHASEKCLVLGSVKVSSDACVVSMMCHPPRQCVEGDTSQTTSLH